MYRLQVFGLSYSYCDNSSHLRHCFALLFLIWLGPFLCWLYCAYSFKTCLPSPIATPHYACRHFGQMLLQEKLFWSWKRSLGSLLPIFSPRPLSISVPKQLSSAPSSCRVLIKLSTVFVQIGVGLYLHNNKKDSLAVSPALEGQIFALCKLCSMLALVRIERLLTHHSVDIFLLNIHKTNHFVIFYQAPCSVGSRKVLFVHEIYLCTIR